MPSIIYDCDPGIDDAMALFLAAGSPEIDILAITTVAGNQTLGVVTRNALALASYLGINAPVAAGADRGLIAPPIIADYIHGSNGLGGVELPDPSRGLDPRHAVELIIDLVMSHEPNEITLVPTGALTNIALAARLEPRIVARVKNVVLMGGAVNGGNITATAEFNIYTDPEAAAIVFGESWPIAMIGLDVTHQALATPEVVGPLTALGTGPARVATQLIDAMGTSYRDNQDFDNPPMHDPCAIAYVIDPGVVEMRPAPVTVSLSGQTRGMTIADLRGSATAGCTTQVGIGLDHPRLWAMVTDAVARLGDR